MGATNVLPHRNLNAHKSISFAVIYFVLQFVGRENFLLFFASDAKKEINLNYLLVTGISTSDWAGNLSQGKGKVISLSHTDKKCARSFIF